MVFLVLARKNSFSLKGIRRMHMEKMITVNRMMLNVQIISCLFTNMRDPTLTNKARRRLGN